MQLLKRLIGSMHIRSRFNRGLRKAEGEVLTYINVHIKIKYKELVPIYISDYLATSTKMLKHIILVEDCESQVAINNKLKNNIVKTLCAGTFKMYNGNFNILHLLNKSLLDEVIFDIPDYTVVVSYIYD